jgi:hypothetical protein
MLGGGGTRQWAVRGEVVRLREPDDSSAGWQDGQGPGCASRFRVAAWTGRQTGGQTESVAVGADEMRASRTGERNTES